MCIQNIKYYEMNAEFDTEFVYFGGAFEPQWRQLHKVKYSLDTEVLCWCVVWKCQISNIYCHRGLGLPWANHSAPFDVWLDCRTMIHMYMIKHDWNVDNFSNERDIYNQELSKHKITKGSPQLRELYISTKITSPLSRIGILRIPRVWDQLLRNLTQVL